MTNTQTKLQVTTEQKTALDAYINNHGKTLKHFEAGRDMWTNTYKSIAILSFDDMAKALYVGYEVPAPKIKVGDWVVPARAEWLSMTRGVRCAEVEAVSTGTLRLKGLDGPYTYDFVRLATPNEVFWAKLGRKENEIRLGDIVLIDQDVYRVSEPSSFSDEVSLEDATLWAQEGEITTVYPAEAAVEIPKE